MSPHNRHRCPGNDRWPPPDVQSTNTSETVGPWQRAHSMPRCVSTSDLFLCVVMAIQASSLHRKSCRDPWLRDLLDRRFRHVPTGRECVPAFERDELLVEPLTITAIGLLDHDVIRQEGAVIQRPRLLPAACGTGLGSLAGETSTKSAISHSRSHRGFPSRNSLQRVRTSSMATGPVFLPPAPAISSPPPAGHRVRRSVREGCRSWTAMSRPNRSSRL